MKNALGLHFVLCILLSIVLFMEYISKKILTLKMLRVNTFDIWVYIKRSWNFLKPTLSSHRISQIDILLNVVSEEKQIYSHLLTLELLKLKGQKSKWQCCSGFGIIQPKMMNISKRKIGIEEQAPWKMVCRGGIKKIAWWWLENILVKVWSKWIKVTVPHLKTFYHIFLCIVRDILNENWRPRRGAVYYREVQLFWNSHLGGENNNKKNPLIWNSKIANMLS